MPNTLLSAQGLQKEFRRHPYRFVLEVDRLNLDAGSIQVLMGPNGSGKSTLALLLAGVIVPDAGEVKINGRWSPWTTAGRRFLSYLHEGSWLYGNLSGEANIKIFSVIAAAAYGESPKRLQEKALKYVGFLGLSREDLRKPVHIYSAGMRRKIELSLTLAVDVPIYILDMPTVDLDPESRWRFFNLIQERKQSGAGFLVSTHIPEEAQFGDLLLFIKKGKIVASVYPEELKRYIHNVVVLRFNPFHQEQLRKALQDIKGAWGDKEVRLYNADFSNVIHMAKVAGVEVFEGYETVPHLGDLYTFLTGEMIANIEEAK
jgi:ABC-2 type transport system ATP-binding protein